jgi:DeoR/GlpR family transcriptional regulator of sugar metabolism
VEPAQDVVEGALALEADTGDLGESDSSVADHPPRRRVAPTGLTTLQVVADVADVHVECLGGTLRHLSQGFVGPLAEAALERFTFDRAFLRADGVTAKLRSRPVPERVRRAMYR